MFFLRLFSLCEQWFKQIGRGARQIEEQQREEQHVAARELVDAEKWAIWMATQQLRVTI